MVVFFVNVTIVPMCACLAHQDASGEIDHNELRTVMTSLGYNPTDKQLEDMMAKVRREFDFCIICKCRCSRRVKCLS